MTQDDVADIEQPATLAQRAWPSARPILAAFVAASIGFVAVAKIQSANPDLSVLGIVLACQAAGLLVILAYPSRYSIATGTGIAAVAVLAAGEPMPVALHLTGWAPAIIVQFLTRDVVLRGLAIGSQALVFAGIHATTGYTGPGYWLPLLLAAVTCLVVVLRTSSTATRAMGVAVTGIVVFVAYA